jgi:hypothetical protein
MMTIDAQNISRSAVCCLQKYCRATANLWDFDMFLLAAQSNSYAGSP